MLSETRTTLPRVAEVLRALRLAQPLDPVTVLAPLALAASLERPARVFVGGTGPDG